VDTVERSGLVAHLFRLLVVVGVLACLTGISAQASAERAAQATVHHAVHHGAAPVATDAPDEPPAVPDHHDGAHGHVCVTTVPTADDVSPLLAPALGTRLATEMTHAFVVPLSGAVGAPARPPTDASVLCVWRT
jgi:hypothetical protein